MSARPGSAMKRAAQRAGVSFGDYVSRVQEGLEYCARCSRWRASACMGTGSNCAACQNAMQEAYRARAVVTIRNPRKVLGEVE